MRKQLAVVDLFAGAGGLAEGFASAVTSDGKKAFSIELSVEKEEHAYLTLRFRAFLRQFKNGLPPEYYSFLNGMIAEPDWESFYPSEWAKASHEAQRLELGSTSAKRVIDARIDDIKRKYGKHVVLIGGPPCQAYSVVGVRRQSL